MELRNGRLEDLLELQELYKGSIQVVCKSDYNRDQIRVWMAGVKNIDRWRDLLIHQFVLIAYDQTKVTGFCSLDKGNYIDFLYVHKDYQRQGIAHKLYTEIELESKRQGTFEITSDVSKTAKLFFEKMGFKVLHEQTVMRAHVELINYKMSKKLEF